MSAPTTAYKSRLQTRFNDEVKNQLMKDLKLDNIEQVPRLEKITVNVGYGRKKDENRHHDAVENSLRKITGQQPTKTVARKSIAGFKLREGQNIGAVSTLRGARMYDFLDRLMTIVMPRLRDFRGVSAKAFDGSGNYSVGLRDQSVFPELNFEDTNIIHGLQVNVTTTAETDEHAYELLKALGMPFEKGKDN
jgi:large subunit ribosomal protein L5